MNHAFNHLDDGTGMTTKKVDRTPVNVLTRLLAASGCVALLLPIACTDRAPGARSPVQDSDVDFWRGMTVQATWTYFETLREMWEISDVAVIGRIVAVREGRTLGGRRGERGTQTTALVQVRVDELVRGDLADDSRRIVDVEIWRANDVPIEEVAAEAPNEPILLLLQDVARQPQPREVDDTVVVREPGKTLYTIATPKALFIERRNDVVTPLDPHPGPYEDSIEASTLPELAAEIRSL